jgi:putative membrane protein insertion efficiency factor
MRRLIAGAIRAYQVAISPMLPSSCRFTPSCSQYALEAVTRHGATRGSWLAARRLLRCHPFGGFGFDPVPGAAAPGTGDPRDPSVDAASAGSSG